MTRRLAAMIAFLLVLGVGTCSLRAAPCNWDEPGRNPFTGSRQAAIMSYTHIPVLDRLAIAWQVRFGKPDDRVGVYLDRIVGGSGSQYGSALYGMHFGRTTKCEEVTRTGWAAGHIEPASAYCRGRWCVVIPDVCGNISWATRDLSAPPVNHVPTPATFGLVLTALAALSLSQRQT